MDNLFPLADLRDPIGTIRGGRFPLTSLERDTFFPAMEYQWAADCVIGIDREHDALGYPLVERNEPSLWAHQIRALREHSLSRLALDLTNEDVGRWVDRKIAKTLIARIMDGITVRSAVLGCTGDLFFLVCVGEIGQHTEIALRPHGEFACLASITPTASNIPTARAALLRALFGREK